MCPHTAIYTHRYTTLYMNDVPGEDLLQHLYRVVSFIDNAREEGGKVRVMSIYLYMYVHKCVHTHMHIYKHFARSEGGKVFVCIYVSKNQGVLSDFFSKK